MISRDQIQAAADRIAGRIRTTPVVAVEPGAIERGGVDRPSPERGAPDRAAPDRVAPARDAAGRGQVWFKLEYLQHTGSFKARGAFNRILAAAEAGELGPAGVLAASGGNAGLAVAYAAAPSGYRRRSTCPAPPRR